MSTILEKVKNIPSQPCFGYFLHGGTRVVGLLDIGVSFFAIFLIGSEMYKSFDKLEMLKQSQDLLKYYFRAASWGCYFAILVSIIAISILLFKAAKKRSSRLCKIWIVLSAVTNTCLFLVFYINHYFFVISTSVHVLGFMYVIYKLYCIHVVWSFVKEIKSYGGFNAALSALTDAEVAEFEKGCPPDTAISEEVVQCQSKGFSKDFEILAENLELDETNILGSGAFGNVYRGEILTETGTTPVAIKTVHNNADIAYFKTLLSELKVMTFIGKHDNVVNLIGACTANIKQKKLYVIVELCPFGNLHDYLKTRRGLFLNMVSDGKLIPISEARSKFSYTNVKNVNTITTLDLLKWMYETSKGLEFLESKKIVHADVAARNILLSNEKVAKVSDFGLATKVYQYTTVVKEETLLPWRWLAIESLSEMQFSTKSDVWAFATTIWESFSLSELPFPGFSWDKDFIEKLKDGLRMKQPKNATNEIYELLLACWRPDPSDRPNFSVIREELEKTWYNAQTFIDCSETSTEICADRTIGSTAEASADKVDIYYIN